MTILMYNILRIGPTNTLVKAYKVMISISCEESESIEKYRYLIFWYANAMHSYEQ